MSACIKRLCHSGLASAPAPALSLIQELMGTVLMIEVISSQLLLVIAIDAGRALRCSARGAATRACRYAQGLKIGEHSLGYAVNRKSAQTSEQ